MKKSIKRNILALLAVFCLTLGLSAPVMARSLVDMSEGATSLASGKTVEGSAFMGGDNVTVDGVIKGDLFCAGNTVTIGGTVEGDVICGANNLTVGGTVRGDVRVGGNTVVLKGRIDGSASVGANSLIIDSSASIGRDLLIGANTASLAGTVERDLRAGVNQLNIDGTVGRNVDGALNGLVIASGAKVGGDIKYTSDHDGSIAEGTVGGSVERSAPSEYSHDNYPMTGREMVQGFMAGALFIAVMFIVFALFVVLVAPRYIRGLADSKTSLDLLKATLVGLVALIVSAPVMLLVAVSGIGLMIAGFLGLAMTMAVVLSGVPVAYLLGKFMLNNRTNNVFVVAALGALVLSILCLLPFIGLLVLFVTVSMGLGLILMGLRSQYEGRAYRVEPAVVVAESKTVKATKKITKK